MAKAKKTNTIQTTVDAYASAQDRSLKLQDALTKALVAKDEARNVLVHHVQQTGNARVAYQAANGDTLVVTPGFAGLGATVETIKPGAQKLPEPPKPATAEIADDVAKLLADGMAAEAQKRIEEALGVNGAQVNTAQTATQVHNEQEARILAKFFQSCAPKIHQRTYRSATMGPIPLSDRAKGLLVENCKAIQVAVARGDYNAADQVVSLSRGKLAQYMSELEQRVNVLTDALNEV